MPLRLVHENLPGIPEAFSPNGKLLGTSEALIEVDTGKILLSFKQVGFEGFSSDGKLLYFIWDDFGGMTCHYQHQEILHWESNKVVGTSTDNVWELDSRNSLKNPWHPPGENPFFTLQDKSEWNDGKHQPVMALVRKGDCFVEGILRWTQWCNLAKIIVQHDSSEPLVAAPSASSKNTSLWKVVSKEG